MAPIARSSLLPMAAACSTIALSGELFVPALQPTTSAPLAINHGASTAGQSSFAGAMSTAVAIGACGLAVSIAGRRQRLAQTSRAAYDAAAQPGVTMPTGFFDPVGFSKDKDEANFRKLRVSEVKHGRVAMLAFLHIGTVAHSARFPGCENFPAGFAALTDSGTLPGIVGMLVVSGVFEVALWKDDASKGPGNFGDPLSVGKAIWIDPNYVSTAELSNGRLAMLGVLGLFVAGLTTGKDVLQQVQGLI